MKKKDRSLWILVALAVAAVSTAAKGQAPSRDFDRYVNAAMTTWKVPGMALAIVEGDRIVYAKGYGTRTLGRSEPVDERTIFAIGSSSKAFTATLMGMLVDDGKVKWDDRVTDHLTGFELNDPYVTREVTVRDLLTHRVGLSRGDLLWYGTSNDRDEILRRVRYLEPSWGFRERFGYQNIMFLAAGQLVAREMGMSWDDVVQRKIFEPLGMTSTTTTIRALSGLPNVATPHAEIDDTVRTIPWRNIDNIGPAGSINSNALDMAQWVRLHLHGGMYEGKRVVSSAVVTEMQTPQTLIRLEGVAARLNPDSRFLTYGFGWFIQDYRGKKVVQHGGNIDGMSALVAMIPEDTIGMVILTNMNGSQLPSVVMNRVFDSHLKAPTRDWSTELHEAIAPLLAQADSQRLQQERDRVTGTHPSHDLEAYTGTYLDTLYGEMSVEEEKGHLVMHRGEGFVGDMEHWHYDVFRVNWRDRMLGRTLVTFTLNAKGEVDAVDAEGIAKFTKRPAVSDSTDAVALSETALRVFVGQYSAAAPPIDLSVEFLNGKLRAILPGQPAYQLAAVDQTTFRITGIPIDVTLAFEVRDGRAVAVVLTQQGATFRLERKG